MPTETLKNDKAKNKTLTIQKPIKLTLIATVVGKYYMFKQIIPQK